MKRALLLICFLISVGLISCTKSDHGAKKNTSSGTEDIAPAFVLKDITGRDVRLSDYKGKMIVLEFWATWCPPCLATIPELISVQKKYADKGLVVLGITIEEGGDLPSKLSTFSKKHKINYPILLGTEEVSKAYGVISIPATFLIGKDDKIIIAFKGYVDNIESLISEHIDKNI